MKNKWNIVVLILAFIGFSVLLYPIVSNWLAAKNHSRVITEYQVTVEQLTRQMVDQELRRSYEYNSNLRGHPISDPFTVSEAGQSEVYYSILNVNGVIGYIDIPVIDVELPIYHTSSDEVLKKGVGHIEGTSFPVGGIGSHAVLTAHRGLPTSKLFTDLDKLDIGDIFFIHVLNRTLSYEVDQVLVVTPEETEALELVSEEDYVTLITCTPYAINSHRLLVRGSAVAYEADKGAAKQKAVRGRLPWVLAIFGIILTVVMITRGMKRRSLNENGQ